MKHTLLYLSLVLLALGCEPAQKPTAKKKQANDIPVQDISKYPGTAFKVSLSSKLDVAKNNFWSSTLPMAFESFNENFSLAEQNRDCSELAMLSADAKRPPSLNEGEYTKKVEVDEEGTIKINVSYDKNLAFRKGWEQRGHQPFLKDTVAFFGQHGDGTLCSIAYYYSDQDFAIKLTTKDTMQEVLLWMPAAVNFSTLSQAYTQLQQKITYFQQQPDIGGRKTFQNVDLVLIPELKLHAKSGHPEIIGCKFAAGDEPFEIKDAWTRLKLILDKHGMVIESESQIEADGEEPEEIQLKPKEMVFNRPFLIVVKRKDKDTPYLLAWIANTELMTKPNK